MHPSQRHNPSQKWHLCTQCFWQRIEPFVVKSGVKAKLPTKPLIKALHCYITPELTSWEQAQNAGQISYRKSSCGGGRLHLSSLLSRCQVFRRTTQPNILHRMGVIIKCRSGWQRYKKHLHVPSTFSLFETLDYQSPSSSRPGCSMDVLVPAGGNSWSCFIRRHILQLSSGIQYELSNFLYHDHYLLSITNQCK